MRRNQVPASIVSITNKGRPNVQHKFWMVTAQGRICWHPPRGLVEHSPHGRLPGCLKDIEVIFYHNTPEVFLNKSVVCWISQACHGGPWPHSREQHSCCRRWCAHVLRLEPRRGAGPRRETGGPVPKPHATPGCGLRGPLPGIWPASRAAAVGSLKYSLL